MKILMYRWKAYNHPDLVEQLRTRGHEVDEVKSELCSFEEDSHFSQLLHDMLDNGNYDLMMTVNYFPIISDICLEYGLKYVSWCCDSPLITLYNQSVFNTNNEIFTFDHINYMEFAEMGANIHYLPLAAAVDRVGGLLETADDLSKYSSEISFVGSMYNKNSYDEVRGHLPDYLKGYFDALLKFQMEIYGENMIQDMLTADIVQELMRNIKLAKTDRSFSDIPLVFSTSVLGFKIAQMERLTMINSLSKTHDIDVYTDDPDADFIFAHNRGTVDYWEEAPKVFNQSKINLNFTIRNIRSGIPLRIWDIMSAGGFVMTNFQMEIPLFFENGKDLVYFDSRKDLEKKVDYYIAHEDERIQIAKNGYEKVRKYHSYTARLDEMAKIVEGI